MNAAQSLFSLETLGHKGCGFPFFFRVIFGPGKKWVTGIFGLFVGAIKRVLFRAPEKAGVFPPLGVPGKKGSRVLKEILCPGEILWPRGSPGGKTAEI